MIDRWKDRLAKAYLYRAFAGPRQNPFHEAAYAEANPDLVVGLKKGRVFSPSWHFAVRGRRQLGAGNPMRRLPFQLGQLTLDYDEASYLENNPDVRSLVASKSYKSGFNHFLKQGYAECVSGLRKPYAETKFVKLRESLPGQATPLRKKYVCLYAHYSPLGVIDEYVVRYLTELRRLGIDIYFVTATDRRDELAKVLDFVVEIFVKNDAGRDFGSWYIALKNIDSRVLDLYEAIILANDSVYFPMASPEAMLSKMHEKKLSFWGITDSRDFDRYHLQSYFLVFDRKARDVLLLKFVHDFEKKPFMTKWGQIVEFELRFAEDAQKAGLKVGAYCPVDEIYDAIFQSKKYARYRRRANSGKQWLNPTHVLWDLLISQWGCPVLKQELLRDNPLSVDVKGWEQVIDARYMDADIIKRHLASVARL